MPQAIPFILGAAAVASTGLSIKSSIDQRKDAKRAIGDMQAQNQAATQSLKDAQGEASGKAQSLLKRRTSSISQTIYTSPLGLSGMASTARKTLLGQ